MVGVPHLVAVQRRLQDLILLDQLPHYLLHLPLCLMLMLMTPAAAGSLHLLPTAPVAAGAASQTVESGETADPSKSKPNPKSTSLYRQSRYSSYLQRRKYLACKLRARRA